MFAAVLLVACAKSPKPYYTAGGAVTLVTDPEIGAASRGAAREMLPSGVGLSRRPLLVGATLRVERASEKPANHSAPCGPNSGALLHSTPPRPAAI